MPGVGLDDDERVKVDAVLLILAPDSREHHVYVARQTLFTLPLLKVDLPTRAEVRVDDPWVDADELAEFLGDLLVGGEVIGFETRRPSCIQRRDDRLLQVFEDFRDARGEVVVEQDHAGIESFYAEPIAFSHQRLEQKLAAVGQSELRRRC